jgi:hypothetical protein
MVDEPHVSGVRPYLITGGRARPVDSTLRIEAQVLTTWEGRAPTGSPTNTALS